MASFLLHRLLALQCVLLAVTPAQAGVTARLSDAPTARTSLFSELLERDATGRVISASATAGPRGTAPDLWRGYRYSSLGRLDRVFKSLPLEPTNGVPLDTSSLAFLPVGSSGVADFAGDLGPSATGDVVLHTPGTGALDSSAVQGFDEAVRGAGHRLLSVEVDGTAFELSYDSSGRVSTREGRPRLFTGCANRVTWRTGVAGPPTGGAVPRVQPPPVVHPRSLVCQAHRFARFGAQSRSTLCEPTDPEVTAGYRLEWDALSRLVAVYAGPGPGVLLERSVYDADGRLAGRFAADGTSDTYIYSGEQMVEAYDTDDEVLWQALWGPGLDELVEFRNVARDGPGAPPLLALTDFRRSVVGVVTADEDDELTVEGFVEYGPWGRVESVADSPMGEWAGCVEVGQVGVQCALPGGSPFGFVGAWRSDRTGLVYMRHRWYDPRLGQFLSHDPLGAVDSANLYTYVAGDPINLWDPWGLKAGGGFEDWATPQDPKADPRDGAQTPSDLFRHFVGMTVGGGRKETLPGDGYAQPGTPNFWPRPKMGFPMLDYPSGLSKPAGMPTFPTQDAQQAINAAGDFVVETAIMWPIGGVTFRILWKASSFVAPTAKRIGAWMLGKTPTVVKEAVEAAAEDASRGGPERRLDERSHRYDMGLTNCSHSDTFGG